MNRFAYRSLCVVALAALLGCGTEPLDEFPQPLDTPAAPGLQKTSFTGVVEPATGRFQLFTGPQAAMAAIPESADGNVNAVATSTVQVYGASVTYNATSSTYPSGCNTLVPMVMQANVEVFSGFTEQLRNVYANIDATSAGASPCHTNSLGTFAGTIGTTKGAFLYQPLNPVTNGSTAIKRTIQWNLALPSSTSPYWFTGDVWAEVIPMPPTSVLPAGNAVYHRATSGNVTVPFSWVADPAANGTNPEGYVVARPSRSRISLSILRCGSAAAAFNAANCTTTILAPTRYTGTTHNQSLATGYWYQWSIRSAFRLPGTSTYSLGSTVITRTLSVVTP